MTCFLLRVDLVDTNIGMTDCNTVIILLGGPVKDPPKSCLLEGFEALKASTERNPFNLHGLLKPFRIHDVGELQSQLPNWSSAISRSLHFWASVLASPAAPWRGHGPLPCPQRAPF